MASKLYGEVAAIQRYAQGLFLGASGGRAPLVKISNHYGRLSPLKFVHWLSFLEFIGLASKVL